MKLSSEQINAYSRDGYLVLSQLFNDTELSLFKSEMFKIAQQGNQGIVMEKNGISPRGLHGCHLESETFSELVKNPRMVLPAKSLLNCPVYVHQFKINTKYPFGGDIWPWHQDYIFWRNEDGISESNLVNVCLFLDDVNEFNGPLTFLKGSHKNGLIDVPEIKEKATCYEDAPDWATNLTSDLKYSLPNEMIQKLVEENELVAPKAKQGSIIIFHPNLVHGSTQNISPFNRSLLLVTYNSINNRPSKPSELSRPEFLCSDKFESI